LFHYPEWDDLPTSLTKSSHMLLDAAATKSDYLLEAAFENDYVNEQEPHESQMTTKPLPVRQTEAKHLFLCKKLEEALAHCRTLAFLINYRCFCFE